MTSTPDCKKTETISTVVHVSSLQISHLVCSKGRFNILNVTKDATKDIYIYKNKYKNKMRNERMRMKNSKQ